LKQEPSLSAENASAGNPEPGMKSLARKEKVTCCFTWWCSIRRIAEGRRGRRACRSR